MLDTAALLAFDRAFQSVTGLARDSVAFDRQTLRRFDVDGRMHVERCNISKANVCPYYGREIPGAEALGLDPNKVYNLYRDPTELARGADTFKNVQLLMLHTAVNANDPKTEITVGTVGSDVAFNSPYLTASIAVWTQEAIKLIESKQQAELSCSYRYRADMTPGVTPEGVAYHGVMRDIMANHVALVEKGRAGPDVYVSDSLPQELFQMKRQKLVDAIVAALGATGANTAALLAVDKAIDAEIDAEDEAAEDAREEAEDTAAEDGEEGAEQRGALKAKDKRAKDRKAKDASAPESPGPKAGERGKSITADNRHGMDGFLTTADAAKITAAAVAQVNALHKARKDVEPLVGVVAFDSAEEVYKFALEKSQVAFDGVSPTAYGALVEQVKLTRKASTPTVKTGAAPKFAMDSASVASQAIPGLGRFTVA